MKRKYYKTYLMAAVMALVMMLAAACSMQSQKSPDREDGAPQQEEPTISVYMHQTGQTQSMKMEEYIAGVVAGEMKSDWPLEALAAQAIVARTFTLQAMEEKGGVPERGTQASTDIKEFQAYDAGQVNDRVKQAVEMTRGMVITYGGKPVKTWFHASAGGKTATAKEGLAYPYEEPPYIQPVDSPDDLAPVDVKSWTAAFSKKEIADILAQKGQAVAAINSMEIGQKGPSGRTVTLLINKNVQVSGPEMRLALGSTKLKSMLLDKVEVKGDQVIFHGKGYGHGVGMSQWGANQLAASGKSPEEIIKHYFQGVALERRWN